MKTGQMPRLIRVFAECTSLCLFCHVGPIYIQPTYTNMEHMLLTLTFALGGGALRHGNFSLAAITRRKSVNTITCGPRQANLVLITYASSEGSGEPAHPRSLARTSAARSYRQ